MVRLKSIDTFRGIAVLAMIWLHVSEWWLSGDSQWFLDVPLFVTQYGFLVSYQFISGISRYLFYKTGGSMIETPEIVNNRKIKRQFLVRGIFLLVVGLLFNSGIAISTSRPSEIWSWFILLSISISIILITPLLDTSKKTRTFLGVFFMVLNFSILWFLQDFEGQTNVFGVLFHLLFYPTGLHPILSSFAVFLIGTVVGEVIYETYYQEEKKRRLNLLKKRLMLPSITIGVILVIFVLIANWFHFLNIPSFYGIISATGISLILFSLFVIIEESKIIKVNKKYNFIFYFSYYSLTIYLVHHLLYFVFFESMNALMSQFAIVLTVVLIGLFLKLIYPKVGGTISIKMIISKLTNKIVMRLDRKKDSDKLE